MYIKKSIIDLIVKLIGFISISILIYLRILSEHTSMQIFMFICFIVITFVLSNIKGWGWLFKIFLLLASAYSCLYYGSLFGFGFSVEFIIADVISVVLASTQNEFHTFFSNVIAHKPFELILSMVSFVGVLIYSIFSKCFKIKDEYRIILWGGVIVDVIIVFFILIFENLGGGVALLTSKIPQYYSQIVRSHKAIKQKEKFDWYAKSKINGKQIVVVILGETTRGDHMSICGYNRATTPKLKQLDTICFKDSISIGNHTLLSTPYMLTRKPVRDDNIHELFGELSVISAFKSAGFKTYYLSYLSSVHVGDNVINQIVSEADVYMQRPWSEYQDSEYLSMVDALLEDGVEKKMIMIKLIGSHFNYQDMYPMAFDKFKPSFKTTEYTGADVSMKKEFINSYDNSILHTDYVVSEIINKLAPIDDAEVSLSFISDHGTSIYEDGKTIYGGVKKANYNAALFFWFGQNIRNRLGSEIDILKYNSDKPVDSTYFVDTVLDIAGIETPMKIGKNLLNKKLDYMDERKVVVGDKVVLYKNLD